MSTTGVNLAMTSLADNHDDNDNHDKDTTNQSQTMSTNHDAEATAGGPSPPQHAHHRDHDSWGTQLYQKFHDAKDNLTDSSSWSQYIYAIVTIVLGSIVGLGFFLLTTIIPIAMIAIGITHWHHCPAIPQLPVLLVASGAVLMLGSLINLADQFLEGYVHHVGGKRRSRLITVVNVLLVGLMLASVVLACVYIYGNPRPADHSADWYHRELFKDSPLEPLHQARKDHLFKDPRSQVVDTPPRPDMLHGTKPDGRMHAGHGYGSWHDEYCHPTVYQFTFWLLNICWVLIGLVVALILLGLVTAHYL